MEDAAVLIIPIIMGGFFLLYLTFYALMFGVIIASMVIWILMLVDVAKRDFKTENDKIVWVLIVALTGIIGAIIYYFAIKKPEDAKKKKKKPNGGQKSG